MQVFWISSSVGRIRRINLTFKTLCMIVAMIALVFILLGFALQYLGFRVAVEYNPELVRKLGGVHTAMEVENLNSFYRGRLSEVFTQLEANAKKISQLEMANERLIMLATPPGALKETARVRAKPQGGPYIPKPTKRSSMSVFDVFDSALYEVRGINDRSAQLIIDVDQRIEWLGSKPITMPLKGVIDITSPFGVRNDPITHAWSTHQGIDFQAPLGATIYASGAGVVHEVGRDKEYGKMVMINHGEGYMTRYAHASEIMVTEGMEVARLTPIAKVGSSGRSTGAHLHFEILKDGRQINPGEWLVGIAPR